MKNRIFFPQAVLDTWLVGERVDLAADELTLLDEGRRYRIREAVRVVREVTGAACPRDLIGRVKARDYLLELGAELMEDSMILGDNAYDVVAGWLGEPIGSWVEHSSSSARLEAIAQAAEPVAATPKSDEELLASFILRMA
jgi:hypothetical protein